MYVLSVVLRAASGFWSEVTRMFMPAAPFCGLLIEPVLWGWGKTPTLGVALGVFPALIPLAFIGLHIFVAIIQTYVFTLLPSIYIGIATAEEH